MYTWLNRIPAPASLFEGFERVSYESTAMDEFKGSLAAAFEKALQDGIPPSAALAAVLDWAASELEGLSEASANR